MTLDQLRTYYRQITGSGSAYSDAELTDLFNEAQREVTEDLGYPRATSGDVSIVGQRTYNLPSGALRILRQGGIRYEGTPLTYATIDQLDTDYSGWKSDDNDTPTIYFQETLDTFGLYPEPKTADDEIETTYLVKPDDMSDSRDIPFSIHGTARAQLAGAHKLIAILVAIDAKIGANKFLQARELHALYDARKDKVLRTISIPARKKMGFGRDPYVMQRRLNRINRG